VSGVLYLVIYNVSQLWNTPYSGLHIWQCTNTT